MMYTIFKVQGTLFQIPQIPQSPFLSCFLFFGYVEFLHIAFYFFGVMLLFKTILIIVGYNGVNETEPPRRRGRIRFDFSPHFPIFLFPYSNPIIFLEGLCNARSASFYAGIFVLNRQSAFRIQPKRHRRADFPAGAVLFLVITPRRSPPSQRRQPRQAGWRAADHTAGT